MWQQLNDITPFNQHDYNSFVWLELSSDDFTELQTSGVEYQLIANPFTLTLGEQSFDPVRQTPTFDNDWGTAVTHNQADLHLVQFTGPTKAEWLDTLTNNGLEIVQYIHPHTYVVWADDAQLQNVTNLAMVRWTGAFLPAYRVLPQWRQLPANNNVQVDVLLYRGADTDSAVRQLEALGTVNLGRAILNQTWEITGLFLPGDQLLTAAQIPGVYSIQLTATDGGLRGEMSNQINVNNHDGSNQAFPGYQAWLNAAGVDGNGVIIANVDGGVLETHADLVNRFIACTGITCGGSDSSDHGTHTAGIMAADGASGITDSFGFLRGQGMAPGANMVEQLYFPFYTQPGGMLLLMTESFNNGASLSGNSWGPAGTPQGYDDDTLQVDIGVRDADPNAAGNQPLSYVLSFMNGNGGTSSQGSPDEAKNIFNIGSTKMQNSNGSQILDINDLSSNTAHGPALDGRTIPHMVAPGCRVDSSVTSGYALFCGTSMASPHVSGAVALFIEYYRGLHGVDPSPALVKAAFLPVAHDLAGNLDADGGILGHPFDSKQGWGRMDVTAVVSPSLDILYFDNPTIFDNTGEEWVQTLSPADPAQPMRLMLVWTDAPGHGLGGSTPAWNNDLNLVVESGGDTYYGNDFDSNGWSQSGGSPDDKNNTEGIFLGPTPPGNITIRVTANNINSDGIPNQGDSTDQDFSLVCINCLAGADFDVAATPPMVEVCIPNDAVYDVTVTSSGNYTPTVNLSAANTPGGTTATFSVNGQSAPYSSTLTIGNTDAATAGMYDIDIIGMGPTSTHTVTVQLNLCAPEIAVEPASLSSTQLTDTAVTHTLTISNVGTGQLDWNIVEQNESTFLETVTVETYPETTQDITDVPPNMQGILRDREPVHDLQPMGATPCIGGMAGIYPCNNVDLLSFLPLGSIGGGSGNDVWGWTGCGGREFALMARTSGSSFVEVTDPVNPIYLGNLPSHTGNSIWRDIKTYADHAFIVSDFNGSHGMQVFDLTQLCNVASPPVTFSETAHYSGFGSAHNLVINEDTGYAYGVGANCSGGLHMVDISTPTSPTGAGCFSADGYTHDAQCIVYNGPDADYQGDEVCFAYNTDTLTIVDVTNKANPTQISRTGYSGFSYTHQGWVTDDHTYVLLDDELDEQDFGHNTRTYVWDISNLDNPMLLGNFTATTAAIDHNLYIKGNYAFQSNYRAGFRILDISDIANANLSEEAYFDIYPTNDNIGFNGSWSNYPYFDSGIVVVSGIEQGLFVLQPTTLPVAGCASASDIPWLTVSPTTGSTAESDSTPINVTFDSTGLTPGEYTAMLCIESNAVTTPEVQVPITLTVAPPPDIIITSPADSTVFTATNGVDIDATIVVTTPNFTVPTDGHWHLWLDGVDTGPVMGYTATVNLSVGTHVISAQLQALDHMPLGPVDTIAVEVVGADIIITSPADNTVFTATNGVDIDTTIVVTIPNFTVPTDGHWHLWLDGVDTGAVMGYTATVNLSVGTHVISAQLQAPDHMPLGPVDTITVTVVSAPVEPPPLQIFLPFVARDD